MASRPQAFDRLLAPLGPSLRLCFLLILSLLVLCSLVTRSDSAIARREVQDASSPFWRHRTSEFAQQDHLIVRRASLIFTGNVSQDFPSESTVVLDDGNHISAVPLAGFFEDTDVPNPLPTRSGFDMRAVYWYYDIVGDTMYVGVDCYGVCGDADGDGQPDTTSAALALLTGLDTPSLSRGEYFLLGIDTSAPQTNRTLRPDVLVGSPLWVLTNGGYSSWTIRHTSTPSLFPTTLDNRSLDNWIQSNFSNFTGTLAPSLGGLIDPEIRLNLFDNNSALGDIEFAIKNFGQLPGLNWNPNGSTTTDPTEPGYGKMAFSFAATLGSRVSGPIGSDFVPNQRGGETVAHRIVIPCPWLPLDPLGRCCPSATKDLCGICGGNNANLDPCGSCRENATTVSSSSCPGAAATWSAIDLNVPSYHTDSLTNMATADFNSDGILELIVGFPDLDIIVVKSIDAQGVVQGSRTFSNPNAVAGQNHQFGYSVTSIGDVNGDGVPDLAVGAPNYNSVGTVYVLVMNADGTVDASRQITAPSYLVTPTEPPTSCEPVPVSAPTTKREPPRRDPNGTPDSPTTSTSPSPPAPIDSAPNGTAPIDPANNPVVPPSTDSPAPVYTPVDSPTFIPDSTPHNYCPPSSPSAGVQFGASITWMGSYFILITAPGAANTTSVSTAFEQEGAFLLAALASDGNAIGVRTLATTLTPALANSSGIPVGEVISTTIGLEIGAAGTIDSSVKIFTSVIWNMANGTMIKTLLTAKVRSDASTSEVAVIKLPDASIPLPSHPDAPLLSSPILAPNYVPTWSTTQYLLVAARDIDGDGNPDIVLSLGSSNTSSVIFIAFLTSNGQVSSTQVVGDHGIGNLRTALASGYRFLPTLTMDSASLSFAGLSARSGGSYFATLCIGPSSDVFLYAIQTWGSQQYVSPGTPVAPPVAAPSPPPSSSPQTITPSSIISPTPSYPLSPRPSSDPLQVQFVQNSPILKIASGTSVWTQFVFTKIIERSSQINSGPLKTLTFPAPSAWTKTVDGEITTFSTFLLDANNVATTAEVQIQVIHFLVDKTIVFSPTTYLGVVKDTVKFSLLLRGWTFVQSKTVLDVVLEFSADSPVISVDTNYASDGQSTTFTLSSTSCDVSFSVPTFAAVDGILSAISAPSFNQTASTFTLTAPPFFDNLFYDPDVTIKARYTPSGIIKDKPSHSLLYIILPTCAAVLIVGVVATILLARLCRHKKEEQRWKDAGAVTP